MLSAPLLIGCDLERLDAFTLGLLTNDEVIALNQDALGQGARRVATLGEVQVYRKPLEDGGTAIGVFNLGTTTHTVTIPLESLGLPPQLRLRDVWRQQDLGVAEHSITTTVGAHDVSLFKLTNR